MQEPDQQNSVKDHELSEGNTANLTSLNEPGVCNRLSTLIKDDIESFTAWKYNDGFRWHLGASKIGDECKRSLWYMFRWVQAPTHNGRQQRLFNRGHLEEARHSEWLRGIGFTVWTHDESISKEDGTHPQLRIKNKCSGHLGGSLDGIAQFPERYKVQGYAVVESKTSGTGKGFNDLGKLGVAKAKTAHYIQNSIYGADYGIEHVLYICGNKNDDDLYIEVAKLDFNLAKQMEEKANSIIFSQEPPGRLSENSNHFQCKNFCDYKDICFGGKPAEKNCRSCTNCAAVDGGNFYCSINAGVIPREFVATGCEAWASIVEQKIFVFNTKAEFEASKKVKAVENTGMFAIESDIAIPE